VLGAGVAAAVDVVVAEVPGLALDKRDEQEVAEERPELYRLFVYTEIDSLEYAARRYGSGLTGDPEVVAKAITQFRRRCRSETFRRVAEECSVEGAYFSSTLDTVRTILDQESDRRAQNQSDAEDKPMPN
jgi:hypothetical protein